MEIPLNVTKDHYSAETICLWQSVWSTICDMCYHSKNIQEELITRPGIFQFDNDVVGWYSESEQNTFYSKRYPFNDEQLFLDHVWKEYSKVAGPGFVPNVVPEFKRLHVPMCLYSTIGVDAWFATCFPNCKVTFWEN